MSTTTEEESASAVEASQEIPPSPEYRELARDMFEKITEYLNGELSATSEEYQLLHRLNQMTIAKYSDMTSLATRLNEVSESLNDKFVSLQPYCDQIDQVESSVSALEQTAYRLDAYCKRLEAKFKEFEKR
ncbi:biogenesis of lysosome-related organelles complex 1 subunit 2-like [Halichondria panicea]|uniref:biogenesis of lysosome-related organelles complex 1 subunit 2-like n=1 Tax=Halichondria panicea TaxID=6063 RepID=UPI00312BC829